MADGSAPKPYPDSDVDLVAEEIAEAFNAGNRACTIPADFASEARAVLDALAEAGRLLPDGVTAATIEAAALTAYADREHPHAEGVSTRTDYGTGIEYDAVCSGCGASWSVDEGGCTERVALLAAAGQDRGSDG